MTYPFAMSTREMEIWDALVRPARHLDHLCESTALLFCRAYAAHEADPTDFDMLVELFKLADALWLPLPDHLGAELQ